MESSVRVRVPLAGVNDSGRSNVGNDKRLRIPHVFRLLDYLIMMTTPTQTND